MTNNAIFSKNALDTSSHIDLSEFTGECKFHEFERYATVLLRHEVNEAFCCTKGLYKMKNQERYRYHFFELIITLLLRRYQ